MSESAVSHQLRVLRSMRMVTYRQKGRNVYYSLTEEGALVRRLPSAIELYRYIKAQSTYQSMINAPFYLNLLVEHHILDILPVPSSIFFISAQHLHLGVLVGADWAC